MIHAPESSIRPTTRLSFDNNSARRTPRDLAAGGLAAMMELGRSCFEELGSELATQGPLPPARVLPALRKVARSIANAESAGVYRDTHSYVYWLGAVFFFAITGRAPLEAAPGAAPALAPPKPSSLSPHPVPPEIDDLVLACFADRHTARFLSVGQLSAALDELPTMEEVRHAREQEHTDPPPSSMVLSDSDAQWLTETRRLRARRGPRALLSVA